MWSRLLTCRRRTWETARKVKTVGGSSVEGSDEKDGYG